MNAVKLWKYAIIVDSTSKYISLSRFSPHSWVRQCYELDQSKNPARFYNTRDILSKRKQSTTKIGILSRPEIQYRLPDSRKSGNFF